MTNTDRDGIAQRAAAVLQAAVRDRGRIEGSLLKVDDFLNHRVEPHLMDEAGRGLAAVAGEPDLVLTAEASGIPPALAASRHLGVPMVYAKKYPRGESSRPAHMRHVSSPTKGEEYRIEVAERVLPPGSKVGIVDDFLSRGRTAEALGEIVEEAGSEVTAMCFVIEKAFVNGRSRLERHGWPVISLVVIEAMGADGVTFAPWHGVAATQG